MIRLRDTGLHPPNLMYPVAFASRRELTPVLCSVRLSWRHRARPSTTLHEIRPAVARGMFNFYHRTAEFARTAFPERS
jgi:hypothetical protein